MNLFTLTAKLGLDTSDFQDKVKQSGADMSDLGSKLKTGLGKAKRATVTLLGMGATAFSGLAKIGLDYNSEMESYTTNFETMLGSTEAAVAKVDELKRMAAKTPFGMGDLADATQTLLAFQVPAEKTSDILTMLGDVALGDKEKMKGLALVFGQVTSAGKLQGQDLMQLINQGFNPLNYIAKRTGESMEELRDRMSKGGVSAAEVEQAFRDATSEGGQFAGGMEKASTTMEGLKSTLKDVVRSKIGQFFENIGKKVKKALPQVIEFVESIDVEKATERLQKMGETFETLLPIIVGVTAATVAYKTAVGIAGIIEAVTKATQGLTLGQAALNAVMNMNPFVLIATLVVGLATAIITLWHTNEDFRNAVIKIWEAIKQAFVKAWEGIKSAWDHAKPYFSAIWAGIKATFSVVKDTLSGFFKAAWDGIKWVWDKSGEYFSLIWKTIKGIFEVVGDVLSGDFSSAWEKIKEIFADWSSFFSGLWEDVKEIFSHVWEKFQEIGGDIIDGIMQGISNAWSGLVNWFNNLWDNLFGGRSVNVNVNRYDNYLGHGYGYNYDGSHANGLDYVPFDGYIAQLHKGETVLTRKEADERRQGRAGTIIERVNIQVDGARYEDPRALAEVIAEQLQEITERRSAVYGY